MRLIGEGRGSMPDGLRCRPALVEDLHNCETQAASLETLGRIIRVKRKASALRIDDAAASCGVSVGLLSRLENGKSGVTTDRVLRVLEGVAPFVMDEEKVARVVAADDIYVGAEKGRVQRIAAFVSQQARKLIDMAPLMLKVELE